MNEQKSSWRSISQQLTEPAITPIAQKRRRFVLQKRVYTILLVLVLLGAIAFCAYYLSAHSKTFAPYAQEQNKTKIIFFSDGQLTETWFNDQFGAIKQKGLLSVDIAGVQKALLNNPQILEATVIRQFPSTLKITLRERSPIARIRLKQDGKVQTYYVAHDGQFFTSAQYKAPATLPYLSGLAVRPVNGQLPALPGALTLAEILDGMKTDFPNLYVQLSQIDLSEWIFPICPQTSVVLQTRSNTKIRFGPENISQELARLRETLQLLATEKQTVNKKMIDLTYPDKVAVLNIN